MAKPILITGSPRSGTGFTLESLTRAGRVAYGEDWAGEDCEYVVSWKHLPIAEKFPDMFADVIHQTRQPRAVVASLYTVAPSSWMQFTSHVPSSAAVDVAAVCAWLCITNRADMVASRRLRVEDAHEWLCVPPIGDTTYNSRQHGVFEIDSIGAYPGIHRTFLEREHLYGY